MKETEDQNRRVEPEIVGQTIDRLCAAVQMPWYGRGDNVLFVGWSPDGKPTLSYDEKFLSSQALESYKITKAVDFPFGRDVAQFPIVPIEFVAQSTPIDRKDKPGQFVEDILVIGISDEKGQISFLKIEEFDAMEAILKGQVVWEDINTKTVFKGDTIPTSSMYTLFFPAKNEQGEDVLYTMLFKPTMQNESNEPMYQQFLIQTIKALVTLDSKQPQSNKKGYESLVQSALVSQDVTGSDAYIVMDALKNWGIVDVSEERLEQIRRESSGKDFKYQLLLLAREAGIVDMPTGEGSGMKNQIDAFTTEELVLIMRRFLRVVSQNSGQSRR